MKPDFIEKIQVEDERREGRRAWLGGVRSLLVAMAVMVLIGLVFVAVWLHYYQQSWRAILA